MKKVLAVITVIVVVCAAGAAFSQPQPQHQPRPHDNHPQMNHQQENRGMQCNPEGMRRNHDEHRRPKLGLVPGMPDEIRAKVVEAAKLRIDLEEVFSRKPIDKAKAMEIFGKIQQAENAVEMWKFEKRLDRMEAFRTQRELNRKIPPAHKRGTPAPAEPAPEREHEAPAPEAPAPEE